MSRYAGWFDLIGEGLERQRPERRKPPKGPIQRTRDEDMTDTVSRRTLARGRRAREEINDRVLEEELVKFARGGDNGDF
jgi:hypothetical protein